MLLPFGPFHLHFGNTQMPVGNDFFFLLAYGQFLYTGFMNKISAHSQVF